MVLQIPAHACTLFRGEVFAAHSGASAPLSSPMQPTVHRWQSQACAESGGAYIIFVSRLLVTEQEHTFGNDWFVGLWRFFSCVEFTAACRANRPGIDERLCSECVRIAFGLFAFELAFPLAPRLASP